ncbi:MAG: cysteine desulfurase [Spirochaetaceae bacterium]|jgi:cysteine desulfurase|nr:cysteine desulfurase [Spirochaetaceae bacterium]
MKRHYFDWAATAAADGAEGSGVQTPFGNPSSKHREGRAARDALENARERCAGALSVEPDQLYWTSGGTESNAIVLFSLLKRLAGTRGALLAGAAEHPSVAENCAAIAELGARVRVVNVEPWGAVSAATLERALEKEPDAALVSAMLVNNETGSIADVGALAAATRGRAGRKILFHSDMVQALGKMPLDLPAWDVDAASFSAHKIGGPRGVGLLYLKRPLEVLASGGKQERGIRSGTENVAGAVRFADCLEKRMAASESDEEAARERMMHTIECLRALSRCSIIPQSRGAADERFSPFILQCAFEGLPGEVMARALDDEGFAVSTGSACSSAAKKRPVLEAMGVERQTASNAIRISQGWSTTQNDVDALLSAIGRILSRL